MRLDCLLPACVRPAGGGDAGGPPPAPRHSTPSALATTPGLAGLSRRGGPAGESAGAMPSGPRGPLPGRESSADEPPLRKGMVVKGLARLIDGGGTVGADAGELRKGIVGSYTHHGNELTFHADDSGDQPINILPYVAGAISYTPMQGRTTISGEFTGCTMAIYNAAGETRVSHVDTAVDSSGEAPSKQRWLAMKAQGLEIADELPTTGMLGDFLDSRPLDPSFASLSILAVASPVTGISSHFVVRQNGEYTVVG